MHGRLSEYKKLGGTLQWIATLYGNELGNVAVGKQMSVEAELQLTAAAGSSTASSDHASASTRSGL